MTTTTIGTCTAFDWCDINHQQEPGHHIGPIGTARDIYGQPVKIELYHCPDTGRTCVFLGEHEISLNEAITAQLALGDAVMRAALIPGAVTR